MIINWSTFHAHNTFTSVPGSISPFSPSDTHAAHGPFLSMVCGNSQAGEFQSFPTYQAAGSDFLTLISIPSFRPQEV